MTVAVSRRRRATFCVVFVKLNLAQRRKDPISATAEIIDWWCGWLEDLSRSGPGSAVCAACPFDKEAERTCQRLRFQSFGMLLGPYDFAIVLNAEAIGDVEDFVVGCLRCARPPTLKFGGEVIDTQTFVGRALGHGVEGEENE